MSGEKNLETLLKTMRPELHTGDYVFCTVKEPGTIPIHDALMIFKEREGNTLIMKKEMADHLQIAYTFVSSWITLTMHSSLEAVGLTAAFSTALADQGISCNVVAGWFHDHIFVEKSASEKAMHILNHLSS